MSFFAASVAMRNLRAQANRDALSGGKLRLYVGTLPADLGAITDQLLVAEYVLPSPSGTVAAGARLEFANGAKVCSNTVAVGDTFTGELKSPVSATNGISIPAGAT
ncbi:MAG: hypothetical protein ACK54L_04240, partial [Betaproteobacteria bacterium]